MRSAGSPGSPDPESKCKPRAGSLTLASPLPQLADGHSPSTAAGLVPLLVEMVKQTDIFSVTCWRREGTRFPFGLRGVFGLLSLLFPPEFVYFITFYLEFLIAVLIKIDIYVFG